MRVIFKLIFFAIAMLLFGAISYGQNASPILGSGTNLQISYNKGGGADDSMTAIPIRKSYIRGGDTLYKNYRLKGRIRVDYDSSRFYYHDGTNDVRVLDTKDTVSLLATISDLQSVSFDTTSLSNRINERVKYTDTSAMLAPYLRKGDTTIMLAPYLRKADTASLSNRINLKVSYTDTAAMLVPYLRKGDSATAYVTPKRLNDTVSAIRSTISGLATVYHRQGGNTYGAAMTQGTLDANSWSVFTNGSGNTRYNITSAGAHAFTGTTYNLTGTTFDFAPTSGTFSINNAGGVTITRGSAAENGLNIGVTAMTPRIIAGLGAGSVASNGRPFINFSQTGTPDANSATITSNSGNLLFTNIGNNGGVIFSGSGSNIPTFAVNNSTTQPLRFAHASHFNGGGITTAFDLMTVYFSNNTNANITYTSGTTTARMVVATPRINTSSTHTGNIEGYVYEPTETAVAAGTTQVAFRANNTNGYGIFVGNSAVKNHFNGHVLIGTTTDDGNNLHVAGTIKADGAIYTGSANVLWVSGSGSPEGVVTAPIGSLYSRTNGGAGSTLYVKESGTGNTGWVAK